MDDAEKGQESTSVPWPFVAYKLIVQPRVPLFSTRVQTGTQAASAGIRLRSAASAIWHTSLRHRVRGPVLTAASASRCDS